MRFFAHDGVATHGPAAIEELLKLPGFDGDTLVCPVGSDDSADWKPALAYPPFKKALLEAATASVSPLAAPLGAPLGAPQAASPMLALLSVGLPPLKPSAPLISPMAPLPLAPAPVVAAPAPKTAPCPRCAHANLEDARFCNSCGASMSALQDISPAPAPPAPAEPPKPPEAAKPEPAPAPEPPKAAPPVEEAKPPLPVDPPKAPDFPAPVEAPKEPEPPPSLDPFSRLDPMSFPADAEPAPMGDSPRRPLQPGKMGQLGAYEEASTAFAAEASAFAPPPSPAAAEPAPAAAPAWKRPAVLAALAGLALVAAGVGYKMTRRPARVPAVAELTPAPAPEPAPAAAPEPAPAEPAPALYSTPAPTSSPSIPDPRAAKAKKKAKAPKAPAVAPKTAEPEAVAAKPKRARKPRPSRAPKPAPAPEAASAEAAPKPAEGGKDPLLEALLADATQGGAEPAAETAAPAAPKAAPKAAAPRPAAKPSQFSLPGLQRPVSASDRAGASAPEAVTKAVDPETAPIAEPGAAPAPAAAPRKPGIEDEPAKPAEGDDLALVQVHEQFDFCAQLLAQGAYGDHFDTCLCKDAREADPYRGRRGAYVSARKKDASYGRLETSASILSSRIEGGTAIVKAKWKSSPKDKGRDASQSWKLEDGLWCQAP